MKKLLILFSGEGSNLENLIRTFQESVDIYAITNRPDAGGIARAKKYGVRVTVIDHTCFESREAFDTELLKAIDSIKPDLTVMAGFMRILTPIITANVRAINVHPSLLPKYKGGKAIERSFESGDIECGVSVHWVTEELDGGSVIAQDSFLRSQDESFESFSGKIRKIEHQLLPKVVSKLL